MGLRVVDGATLYSCVGEPGAELWGTSTLMNLTLAWAGLPGAVGGGGVGGALFSSCVTWVRSPEPAQRERVPRE